MAISSTVISDTLALMIVIWGLFFQESGSFSGERTMTLHLDSFAGVVDEFFACGSACSED
ncbi:MAG: hypothetical protein R3B93_28755 [Bacteroidia bacterium]